MAFSTRPREKVRVRAKRRNRAREEMTITMSLNAGACQKGCAAENSVRDYWRWARHGHGGWLWRRKL